MREDQINIFSSYQSISQSWCICVGITPFFIRHNYTSNHTQIHQLQSINMRPHITSFQMTAKKLLHWKSHRPPSKHEPQLMKLCGQQLLTNKAVDHSFRIAKIAKDFYVLYSNEILQALKDDYSASVVELSSLFNYGFRQRIHRHTFEQWIKYNHSSQYSCYYNS